MKLQSSSLSQALEQIGARYLPGTASFYSKLPNDPWAEAHAEIEKAMEAALGRADYFEMMSPHIENFKNRIFKLLEDYKPFSQGQKATAFELGLYSSGVKTEDAAADQASAKWSSQSKRCAICVGEVGIRIARHPEKGLGIYCTNCFQK